MHRVSMLAVLFVASLIIISCSGSSGSPVMPDTASPGLTSSQSPTGQHAASSKAVWGIWEVYLNPANGDFSYVPLRGTQYTVDVVTFLQAPVGNPANLSLAVTDVSNWFTEGLITCVVGLRHPFPGLDQYSGFDVYGAFMAPGSVSGQYDSDIAYSNGDDEPLLVNADGYTRWMNPVEFPDTGTILDFTPGKLSISPVDLFTSTINGYKYFADGLALDEDIAGFFSDPLNTENRGVFKPGSFNEREYDLKFPMVGGSPQLVFQYAVIASWIEPDSALSGDPDVLDVPGDFPYNANADEAVYISVTDNSTLYYDGSEGGGAINLSLEIFDWAALQDDKCVLDEIHQLVVEDPGGVIPSGFATFDNMALAGSATDGSTLISSVFEVEITGCQPVSGNPVDVLITVENEDPNTFDVGSGIPNNDDALAGYFLIPVSVGDEAPEDFAVISPNGGETLWMALYHEITWNPDFPGVDNVRIEFSSDDFVSDIYTIIDSTENDGSFDWLPIPNFETDTGLIRISDVDDAVSDESDDYFSIQEPVWLDFEDEVVITNSTVPFSVTYYQDRDDFSPALSQDNDGLAHIVWHNLTYAYARDTAIRSFDGDNWQGDAFFFTSGGTTNIRLDRMKVAPAANNTTFAMIQHYNVYFSVDVDHNMNGHNNYNWPCLNIGPRIYQNGEIVCDDLYLYQIADAPLSDGPGIYSQRVPTPNYSWTAGVRITLTPYGEVSHSRSWAFQDDTLLLGYYTLSNEIKLLKQTDQASDTWDDTEVIFSGSDNGYSASRHPSLAVDENDRLFAIWVAIEDATGDWHLLASMKETPTSSWTTPVIVATADEEIEDAHLTAGFEVAELPTGDEEFPVLVGYEVGGVVYSQISPMDLWAFLPAHQVSADGDITRDPDTLCHQSPYVYDALFAWSFEVTPGELGVGNYDISFRNADFETP